jgi:DNA-binding response OmpR family regulator
MTRILVVEDDPSIRLGLEDTLRAKGYEVEAVTRGEDALDKAATGRYALVILDIMLPGIDGFEVCRRLRQGRPPASQVPVIVLSARGAELDRVRGLEIGADDYVTKPFSLMELLARVSSVLRRAQGPAREPQALRFGDIAIDFARQIATRGGARLDLPARAFAILKVFARRPGEVVSRDVLLDEAWGYEAYPNTRTVDNHLVKLRRALEDEPERPRWLLTVHGAGYKLDISPEAVVAAEAVAGSAGRP